MTARCTSMRDRARPPARASRRLSTPTPCSPVIVPPSARPSVHDLAERASAPRARGVGSVGSKTTVGCMLPSPAWPTTPIDRPSRSAISSTASMRSAEPGPRHGDVVDQGGPERLQGGEHRPAGRQQQLGLRPGRPASITSLAPLGPRELADRRDLVARPSPPGVGLPDEHRAAVVGQVGVAGRRCSRAATSGP